ncbi:MAG: phosphopantetheine-binding protein [Actinomycetota bacterium]|nr:phosphopantetheine-binding protein [Actinomycetota bacterium]MDQ3901789.1 phosphopantetheine-binding protein [Actinomycetota bacterium]
MTPDEDRILAEVTRMLVEIIGEDYVLNLNIGMDTYFDADLELESIEFVRLAAKLTERFGERVNFVAFLADRKIDEIINLTVGDVVRHVADRMATSAVGGAHA